MKIHALFLCFLFLNISGCSTTKYAKDILPDDIPESNYSNYDCAKILDELNRVTTRLKVVSGAQDASKKDDVNMAVVAAILFWPALFAIDNEDHAILIAKLKGEHETLLRINQSNCVNIDNASLAMKSMDVPPWASLEQEVIYYSNE